MIFLAYQPTAGYLGAISKKGNTMGTYKREGFHVFSECDCSSRLEKKKSAISQAIKGQNDDYILNVNKEEYIQDLIAKFKIDPIEIFKDQLFVSNREEQIPAEMHPNNYFVDCDTSYPRDVIQFHLPFSGDQELLNVRPSTYSMSAPLITLVDNCICFKLINFNLTPKRIKQESDKIINSIVSLNACLEKDLSNFNNSIESTATQVFDARKQQLLQKNDLMSALGTPSRQAGKTSNTFSVPAERTKAIAEKPKPTVTKKG